MFTTTPQSILRPLEVSRTQEEKQRWQANRYGTMLEEPPGNTPGLQSPPALGTRLAVVRLSPTPQRGLRALYPGPKAARQAASRRLPGRPAPSDR
jgi:hypothetical protein